MPAALRHVPRHPEDAPAGRLVQVRLDRGRVVAQIRRAALVVAGELLQRVGVMRPELHVPLERGDRLVGLVLVRERRRQLAPGGCVGRVLGDLVARVGFRRPRRGAAAVEDVADTGSAAAADPEDHEADPEDEREEDEHPLRLPPELGEEHLRLDGGELRRRPRAGAATARARLGLALLLALGA